MAGAIKGITVVIDGETTPLKRALREMRSEATILGKELSAVNKLVQLNPTSLTSVTRQQALYNQALATSAKSLQNMRSAQQQILAHTGGLTTATKAQVREFQNLNAKIAEETLRYQELSRAAASVGASASASMVRVGNMATSMSKTSAAVASKLGYVSVAAGLIGAAAIYAGAKFESSFTGVRKTTEATEEQFEKLAQSMREMALVKAIDVNDLNYIAELGGQLGIAEENLAKFAATMADLSVSTNITIEDGTTAMAQFMNVMGEAQTNIDRVGASIADLGNNTATTESDILLMAQRIAGTGAQIGLTTADVLGLAASLSEVGIRAEMGGNAISTIMNRIDKDVATSGDTLSVWAETAGMSAEQFSNLWQTDVMSAVTAVITGMGQVTDEGGNLNILLDELGITYMRQIDTVKRLANTSESMAGNIALSNSAWEENSALTEEANKRYDTTESKLQLMKNALNEAGIAISEQILPAFKDLVLGVTGAVKAFANMDDGAKSAIVTLGSIALASYPVVKGFSLISGATGKVISGIASVVTKLRGFWEAQKVAETASASFTTATSATAAAAQAAAGAAGAAAKPVSSMASAVGAAAQASTAAAKPLSQLSYSTMAAASAANVFGSNAGALTKISYTTGEVAGTAAVAMTNFGSAATAAATPLAQMSRSAETAGAAVAAMPLAKFSREAGSAASAASTLGAEVLASSYGMTGVGSAAGSASRALTSVNYTASTAADTMRAIGASSTAAVAPLSSMSYSTMTAADALAAFGKASSGTSATAATFANTASAAAVPLSKFSYSAKSAAETANALSGVTAAAATPLSSMANASTSAAAAAASYASAAPRAASAASNVAAAATKAAVPLSQMAYSTASAAEMASTFASAAPVAARATTNVASAATAARVPLSQLSYTTATAAETTASVGAAYASATKSTGLFATAVAALKVKLAALSPVLPAVAAAIGAVVTVVALCKAADEEWTEATKQNAAAMDAAKADYEAAKSAYGEFSDEALVAKGRLDEATTTFNENKETLGELRERVHSVVEEYQSASSSISESYGDAYSSAGAIKSLAEEAANAAGSFDGTSESAARIDAILETLNSQCGTTSFSFNQMTGEIEGSADAMKAAADFIAEGKLYSAASEGYSEAYGKVQELEEAYADLNAQLEGTGVTAEKVLNGGILGTYKGEQLTNSFRETKDALDDAKSEAESYLEKMETLGERQNAATSAAKEYNRAIKAGADEQSALDAVMQKYADTLNKEGDALVVKAQATQLAAQADAAAAESAQDAVDAMEDLLASNTALSDGLAEMGVSASDAAGYLKDAGIDVEEFGDEIQETADKASDGFNRISDDSSVTLEEFQSNLQHNITVTEEWGENMKSLWMRAGSESTKQFLTYIQNAGPEQATLVAQLAASTDEQLQQVVSLWGQGGSAGVGAYVGQTAAAMPSAYAASSAVGTASVQGMTDGGAGSGSAGETVAADFVGPILSCDSYSPGVSTAVESVQGMSDGGSGATAAGTATATQYGNGISSVSSLTYVAFKAIVLASRARDAAAGVGFYSAGESGAQGFASGLTSGSSIAAVSSAGTQLGNAAYAAAKAAIEAKSPSKRFMRLGGYAAQGFALGIDEGASLAEESARALGDASASALGDALSGFGALSMDGSSRTAVLAVEHSVRAEQAGAVGAALSAASAGATTNNYSINGLSYNDDAGVNALISEFMTELIRRQRANLAASRG